MAEASSVDGRYEWQGTVGLITKRTISAWHLDPSDARLDPIHVDPEKLARWLDVARGFAATGSVLIIELTDFAQDPVRHRIRHAADAARDLVGRLRSRHTAVAEELATELEIVADK